MSKFIRAGGAAVVLALVLAAPAAGGAGVFVRVEGQAATLLPRTAVTLPDAPEPVTRCPADSAAAAIEVATAGNWDRQVFTQTILGETHSFADNDFWNLWVFRGGRYVVADGVCDEKLAAGEELLAAYQIADANFAPTVFPLWLEDVPAVVRPGEPFTVTVAATACETRFCNPGEGHRVARAGATVSSGFVSAVSNGQGTATLTLAGRGPAMLRATAPGGLPTAVATVCASDGADGFCGTVRPGEPAPAAPVAAACRTTGDDGLCGTRDRRPAAGRIAGIAEQQRFTLADAPRELRGSVDADPSGLHSVKLSLTRETRGRCWAFGRRRERFRRTRCGAHPVFTIGRTAAWSYLLPARLGRGRYVLDVRVTDGAFNRDPLARGRNRIVFHVG